MENRRPPRSNSTDRKSYFGQGRGAPQNRTNNRSGNNDRTKGDRPVGRGTDNRNADHRGSDHRGGGVRSRFNDSRTRDGRTDGRYARKDGFSPGGYNKRRPDAKRGPARGKREPEPENTEKITSDSQITDGRFRGRKLLNSVSPKTVQTNRKLREVFFKVVSRRVKGGRILDLGCGCGTIGIEAISRGAMLATFVERSARFCAILRKNLGEMGIKEGHGEVVEGEILTFIKKAAHRKRFWDLVYFDLPAGDEHTAILDGLTSGCAIKSHGLLIIEHQPDFIHPDNLKQLRPWRTIDHGEKILSIYERI